MLQFLSDQIDQLDLAVDQVAMRDRNFDRFALMLIDNVVELTLHEHARSIESENRMRAARVPEPQHDPKLVIAALGPNFDAKLRLAKATQLVPKDVADSVLALHTLRNAVYHQGLRHEAILHAAAIFYFQCACKILGEFTPRFWSSSSQDRISHRAMKYLGKISFFGQKETFSNACKRLAEVGDSFEQTLITDLHSDMANTIEETNQALGFLEQNSPTQITRAQAVVDAQAWPFASTDEAEKWAINNGWTSAFDRNYVSWLSANYSWPYRSDPVPSWKKRLSSLQKEQNPHAALKKYSDFVRQTQDVRSKISGLASDLDGYIQQQIDVARGK